MASEQIKSKERVAEREDFKITKKFLPSTYSIMFRIFSREIAFEHFMSKMYIN